MLFGLRPAVALLFLIVGLTLGIGIYTFLYAKGYSYMTNDPAACANCHVMEAHYASWTKSSHRSVAACNDCHTPSSFIGKYTTKASNGFWHSFAFTTGDFPDPLRIKPHNLEIAEAACRKCHTEITDAIEHGGERLSSEVTQISCIRCHNTVGHWVR